MRENGQKRRKKKGQAQLSSELFLILHEMKLSTSHHYWPHWLKLLGSASQEHLEGYTSLCMTQSLMFSSLPKQLMVIHVDTGCSINEQNGLLPFSSADG